MKEKNAGKSPFSELHHVTIAVWDIDRVVEYYESIGIGPFEPYPPMGEYVTVSGIDEAVFYKFKVKVAQIGPISLQLVQPPPDGKSPYRKFLVTKGEGVEHLGFVVEDVDKAEAELKKLGLRATMKGRRVDGSGFTYFDTDEIGGVTLLIRQNPSEK